MIVITDASGGTGSLVLPVPVAPVVTLRHTRQPPCELAGVTAGESAVGGMVNWSVVCHLHVALVSPALIAEMMSTLLTY